MRSSNKSIHFLNPYIDKDIILLKLFWYVSKESVCPDCKETNSKLKTLVTQNVYLNLSDTHKLSFCTSCLNVVILCVCMCKDFGLQKICPLKFLLINQCLSVIYDCWILFNPIRPLGFSCKARMRTPLSGQGHCTDQWSQSPAEMGRLLYPPM